MYGSDEYVISQGRVQAFVFSEHMTDEDEPDIVVRIWLENIRGGFESHLKGLTQIVCGLVEGLRVQSVERIWLEQICRGFESSAGCCQKCTLNDVALLPGIA